MMSLPILKVTTTLSTAALARQFVQSELVFSQSLCEPLPTESGVFCDPTLSPLPAANRALDVFVADVAAADELLQTVDAAFAGAGGVCRQWSINPTTPADIRAKLEAALLASGFAKRSIDLLLLRRSPALSEAVGDLQIIPGRTSPAAVGRLFAESSLPHASAVAAAMSRWVDEPRLDSLLALEHGKPVGFVGVLTLGQVGRIMHLFVAEPHRKRGVGTVLLHRALEICARSLFHHVFAADEDEASTELLKKFQFQSTTRVEQFDLRGATKNV